MAANQRQLEQSDLQLIRRIRDMPQLYDSRHPSFRVAYRKELEWHRLATEMGLTPAVARRRWTCLRDRYSRELRQARAEPHKANLGTSETFRAMDFLRSYVRKRKERQVRLPLNYDSGSETNPAKDYEKSVILDESEDMEREDIEVEPLEEDTAQPYVVSDQISFVAKMEINSNSQPYQEFVDVDENEAYEYVDQQAIETTAPECVEASKPAASDVSGGSAYSGSDPPSSYMDAAPETPKKAPSTETPTSPQKSELGDKDTVDDFFCKSVAGYLRHLSRRHKIKAKVEIFQILEKYIEMEENDAAYESKQRKS